MASSSGNTGLSAFGEALGSIQTTAKWIVGSAAVVLGAIIGGLQLKDLGPLRDAPLSLLAIACLACLVAIGGVGWILIAAARVLITQGLTLTDIALLELEIRLAKRPFPPGARVSDYDPLLGSLYKADLLPDGIDDVRTFRNTYDDISNAADLARSAGDANAVARLEAQVSQYRERAEQLIDAAHLYQARQAFGRLIKALLIGGGVAVIAIIGFILATASQTSLITTPMQVHVMIAQNAPSRDLTAAGLAPGCAGQTLTGAAIGGSYAEPVVVTYQAPLCPAQQFTLSRALGIAIPVINPPDQSLVTTPVQVHVMIAHNAPSRDLTAAGLAPGCAGQTLTGAAIGGSYAEPVVVTNQAPLCPAQQFTLSRALGIAIPVINPPAEEAAPSPSSSPTRRPCARHNSSRFAWH